MSTNPTLKLLAAITALLTSFDATVAQTVGTVDTSNVKEVRINPAAALGDEVEADDIFSSVEYIPLETNSRSLFGRIDQMDLLDGKFVILDKTALSDGRRWIASVLIFESNGQFRARIDVPDQINFITVDRNRKEILVFNSSVKLGLLYYDLDGKLLRSEPWPFPITNIAYTTGGLMAVTKGYRMSSWMRKFPAQVKQHNLLLYKPGFEPHKAFLKFDTALVSDQTTTMAGDGKPISYSGRQILIRQPHQFNIFKLNEDKLSQMVKFIFPMKNTVPANFLFGPEYQKRVDFMNNKPDWIVDMRGIYQTGNILSVSFFFNRGDQTFFYDLKNNLLTSLVAVKPDNINIIVPLNNPIVASDGKLMYTWLKSAPFFSKQRSVSDIIKVDRELGMKLIKNGKTGIPVDVAADYKGKSANLSKFLKEGSAKANPVLIALKVI